MVQITDILIISMDKSDDSWAIEGEIIFEEDLSSPFSVAYSPEYDELDDLEIEIIPGKFDKILLKDIWVGTPLFLDGILGSNWFRNKAIRVDMKNGIFEISE